MHPIHRAVACILLALIVFSVKPAFAQGEVLAYGAGGVLTSNAANAFIEALKFMHIQIGEPIPFNDAQITTAITANFAGLALGDQSDVANMPAYWTQIRTQWTALPSRNKQQLAYQVFRLAYGEAIANQALGGGSSDSSIGTDSSKPTIRGDGNGSYLGYGNGCSYVTTPNGSMKFCN